MKRNAWLLLMCVGLVTGCASHYQITLNNGAQITAYSKPKLKNGDYFYKDASGRKVFLPAGRVKEIAPASMSKEENAPVKTKSAK